MLCIHNHTLIIHYIIDILIILRILYVAIRKARQKANNNPGSHYSEQSERFGQRLAIPLPGEKTFIDDC